ncbi:Uncharacterised protein [Nocardia farcinica]|uniref:EfeO-type cupredoxin-like domain-containing protein n=1 Tax=Nocardia farcinica TaxID=37329 RepID=A0A449GE35_NOCFR|nr:hypothetical protein [Nocardia farcinica]VFA90804.1 Uncharacterised protein [Nocardia farcinica]
MTRPLGYAALVALTAAALTACGSDEPTAPRAEDFASASTAASNPAEDAVVVDVRIAGGTVTPTNAQAEAKVGRPITLVVDSDAEDELHVHASPEHTFPVRVGAGQRFTFTVDVPGRVEVELHDAGRTVTTLLVRP